MLRVAIALNTPNLLAENYFSQVESILLSFIASQLEKDNRLRLSTVKKNPLFILQILFTYLKKQFHASMFL